MSLDIKLSQAYEVLEDSGGNIVKDAKDAVARVSTVLKGSGRVTFDRRKNLAASVDIQATADSSTTTIKSGDKSERKLKTMLRVKLKP